MSDALGIHLAEEADPDSTHEQIWAATFSTFFTKLIVALTFALPLLLLPLQTAVIVSVIWGLTVILLISIYLARVQRVSFLPVAAEHLLIAIVVIAVSHFIGGWVQQVFS